MPQRQIKCTNVRNKGGRIYARFSDKTEMEFGSRAEIRQWIRQQLTVDTLKAMVLSSVLEDAADTTPLSQCDGKRLILDFAQPVVLQIIQE